MPALAGSPFGAPLSLLLEMGEQDVGSRLGGALLAAHRVQLDMTSSLVEDGCASELGGALYIKFAAAYNAARDKSVRLVFHGTREANIEQICANGLDPQYRGKNGQALGAGEYFAENPQISIPYCAGGARMLVFGAPPPW